MSLAFKRMYVDIPPDTHTRLKQEAKNRGMSMKVLVADLIEKACTSKSKPKRATKKRTKRSNK